MENLLLRNRSPKNKLLKWWPGDTKEKFMENTKYHFPLLKHNHWDAHSIDYQFDAYGFRNDQSFDKVQKYNLVLGCSHSFGIGVRNKDIWFNYLKPHFKEPFYNGSVAGCSPSTCLRTLKGLMQEGMKIKRVFLFIPDRSRTEIYNPDSRWNAWDTVAWWTNHDKNLIKYLLDENYLQYQYETILDSLESICQKNKIQYVFHPTDGQDEIDMMISNDRRGRDLEHPGIDAHKQIGEFFYDEYCRRYRSST